MFNINPLDTVNMIQFSWSFESTLGHISFEILKKCVYNTDIDQWIMTNDIMDVLTQSTVCKGLILWKSYQIYWIIQILILFFILMPVSRLYDLSISSFLGIYCAVHNIPSKCWSISAQMVIVEFCIECWLLFNRYYLTLHIR